MPLFIDIHEIPGVTTEAAAAEHIKDTAIQGRYDVNYTKYWINEQSGKIFCLCEAPTVEAAMEVHREAHGVTADKIIEVTPELAEMFMGTAETDAGGAVLLPSRTANEYDSGVRTILFTDIVGSTTMTQKIGDAAAFELLQVHDAIVRKAILATEGREVKHTGDGIMAVFLSSVSAIRCASRVQNDLLAYGETNSTSALQVRIGLAAGDPVEHHSDFFGASVQLAARLCAHAEPEQILVSNEVTELCAGKDVAFHDLGEVTLKGFDEGVHAHSVDWTRTPV